MLVHTDSYALITENHGHEDEGTCCRCTAVDRFEAEQRLGLGRCMTCLCRSHLEHYTERLVGHPVGHPVDYPAGRLWDYHVDRLGGQSVERLVVEHRNARRRNVEHQRQEHRREGRPYPRPLYPLLRQSHNCHPGTRDLLVFCCGPIALSAYRRKALDHG